MQVADPTLDQFVKIDATAYMIWQIAEHLRDGLWCDEFSHRVFDKALEHLVAGRFTSWPDASLYGEAMVRFSRFLPNRILANPGLMMRRHGARLRARDSQPIQTDGTSLTPA